MKCTTSTLLSKVFMGLTVAIMALSCTPDQKSAEQPTEQQAIGAGFYKPEQALGDLFHDVQSSGIFQDSKYFVDFTPKMSPQEILANYEKEKATEGFDLKAFVDKYFNEPYSPEAKPIERLPSLEEHLPNHWDYLTRSSDSIIGNSTLIPLPNPYIVPGGRFREIYYWDSYFTMIGLAATGRMDMVDNMLDNFAHLIDEVGFIPNGNRSYFLGRSQPPFFGAMVALKARYSGEGTVIKYLPQLQKEYDFWMDGKDLLQKEGDSHRRVVMVAPDLVLNRYYDDIAAPRPEAYHEDVKLVASMSDADKQKVWRNLRAACESGWDFSARWFAHEDDFSTINTINLIPVDLNSLLYQLEVTLSALYTLSGNQDQAGYMAGLSEKRRQAVLKYCWNQEIGMFADYNFVSQKPSNFKSLAGLFPLYFRISSPEYAEITAESIKKQFILPGGVATSLKASGQQWDYPNGWAPLQWITIRGLEHYGHEEPAKKIMNNWLTMNRKVFDKTQKMMEKYNVADTSLIAGGGEYPNQDGFGWTNGVAIALILNTEKY